MNKIPLYLLLFIILPVFVCQAQPGGASFRFDPILVEQVVRANDVVRYKINIDNNDQYHPITVEISIVDIIEDRNGQYQLRQPGSTPYSLAAWATVDISTLVIPPGRTRQVEVTINVPRGVAGGLYGAVALTLVPEKAQVEEEVFASSEFYFQAASFIELVVAGTALRKEAYADSFEVMASGNIPILRNRVGDNALVFSLGVANEGNVHIVTRGTLLIQTAEGRTVGRFPLGGGRGVIIPGATVELRSVLTRPFPPGEYKARAIIEYGGLRPSIAELNFSVSEDIIVQERQEGSNPARFWVAPQEVDVQLRAGAFSNVVLELTNRGSKTIDLAGDILTLEFDRYGDFKPVEERVSAPDWFELSPAKLTLQPGQSRRIRLMFRPPREAAGAYFADVIFKAGDLGIHTEGGVSVFAFVGDKVETEAEIGVVELTETSEALALDVYFANKGNIHLQPQLQLVFNRLQPQIELESGQVVGPSSETITTITLPSGNPVLPQTERLFSFYIPTQLEQGEYEILIRADYDGDEPEILRVKFNVQGG